MSNSRRSRRRCAPPEPQLITLTLGPFDPCPFCDDRTIHHLHASGDEDGCTVVVNVERASASTETLSATDSTCTGAISGHST